jgi:hypothetical protein
MTKQQVQEAIHILQTIDPASPEAYDNAVNAYKHIGKLPFFILDLPNLPINVFHTRTHETDNYFKGIDEIDLPPEAAVKYFARCNAPHQPVFYCSDYRPTSYMELLEYWVEQKKDKYLFVTIGKWTIENSLKVLIVTSPHASDRLTSYDKTHGEKLDHFINQQNEQMKAAMILLYKFLFDKFRKPAKKDPQTYIITSAYCNFAFNQTKDNIDAILYPSVPYDGKGINIAIKATYAFEKNMKLILVARDTFERTEENGLTSYKQVDFHQAQSVDYSKRIIIW